MKRYLLAFALFISIAITFLFHVQLIKWSINRGLASSGFYLEELNSLSVNSKMITIEHMCFSQLSKHRRLCAKKVALTYSITDLQLLTLLIDNLHLSLSTDESRADTFPVEHSAQTTLMPAAKLDDVLRQYSSITLPNLSIHHLTIDGYIDKGALEWEKISETAVEKSQENEAIKNDSQQYQLRISSQRRLLVIDLTGRWRGDLEDSLEAQVQLKFDEAQIIVLQLRLQRDSTDASVFPGLTLSVLADVALKPLSEQLRPHYEIPWQLYGGRATIDADIRTHSAITTSLAKPVSISFKHNTALHLLLGSPSQSLVPAEFQLVLKDPLKMVMSYAGEMNSSLPSDRVLDLSLSGGLMAFSLKEWDSIDTIEGNLSHISCALATSACDLDLNMAIFAENYQLGEFQLVGLRAEGQSHLQFRNGEIFADLHEGELFSIASVESTDVSLHSINALTVGEFNLRLSLGSRDSDMAFKKAVLAFDKLIVKSTYRKKWVKSSVSSNELAAQNGAIELVSELEVSKFDANFEEALQANFHLHSSDIRANYPGVWMPVITADAQIGFNDNTVSLNGLVTTDKAETLFDFKGRHHFSDNKGQLSLSTGIRTFNTESEELSKWFTNWPYDWDILGGTVSSDTTISWQLLDSNYELQGSNSSSLNGVAGFYGDLAFAGLTTSLNSSMSADKFVRSKGVDVHMDLLDFGLQLSDINMRLSFDSEKELIILEQLDADLLGGSIGASEFRYIAGAEDNVLYLSIDGLQISRLLEMVDYDDVQANGAISGVLPINISHDGVSVEDGQFAALSPGGVIRYVPADGIRLGEDNQAMKLVYEALENYQYNTLMSSATYSKAGDLELGIKLQGRNPDLNNGQQINLNLNITDNVPSLLKSLQSGRVIGEILERELSQ